MPWAVDALKKQNALTLQGRTVLVPFGDFQRYDLVIDDDGVFSRVQCKLGKLTADKGALYFHSCSIDSRSQKGRCIRKGYVGQVEFFGVYCEALDTKYLVPVAEAPGTHCYLRLTPPKNGQKKGIRWAADYELLPTWGNGSKSENRRK